MPMSMTPVPAREIRHVIHEDDLDKNRGNFFVAEELLKKSIPAYRSLDGVLEVSSGKLHVMLHYDTKAYNYVWCEDTNAYPNCSCDRCCNERSETRQEHDLNVVRNTNISAITIAAQRALAIEEERIERQRRQQQRIGAWRTMEEGIRRAPIAMQQTEPKIEVQEVNVQRQVRLKD